MIALPTFRGILAKGSSVDPDASAYFSRITTAGSSITTANQSAVNAFIVGCKADGIWNAIKASCLLAGPNDLTGALVPLVGTAPTNLNFVSGDYNRTTGLVGDGTTKYLNSNRANNAEPQSNHHLSAFSTTTTSGVLIGGGGSGAGSSVIGRSVASLWPFRSRIGSFDGTSQGSRSTLLITGFIGLSRSVSANCISRISASNETILSVSTTSTSDTSFIFARNGGGSPAGYSADRLSFYSIGESIDLALLDARITTYMSSLT
jgi:hypothetical protein